MANFFDRAGMSSATAGTGTITLGAALGAVSPNTCSFESFSAAGVQDQNIVSYLILDAAGGAWETGWGVYTASGTTLTRNVTKSSNANALVSLSGNEQVFITSRAEDMATIEALAAANIVINGGMDVSQFNGNTSIAANNYIVDCWLVVATGSMVVVAQQIAPPGSPAFGAAFPNCLQLKATTGAALGAGDYTFYQGRIEGLRIARLGFGAAGAQAVTIGFWVYATIAGTMTVSLRNGGATRSYLANVVINNPTTWEWKCVTIPGDTTGTWPNDTTMGANLGFDFGCGSTFQGTNNAWNAGNFVGTSATTNFVATTNNVTAVTGVVMLPGAHQLSQEQSPQLMRSVPMDLFLCQRYYEKSYNYSVLPGALDGNAALYSFLLLPNLTAGINQAGGTISWKVRKRAAPTVTTYSPTSGASGKIRDYGAGADVTATINSSGDTGCFWAAANSASNTQANYGFHWVADARL